MTSDERARQLLAAIGRNEPTDDELLTVRDFLLGFEEEVATAALGETPGLATGVTDAMASLEAPSPSWYVASEEALTDIVQQTWGGKLPEAVASRSAAWARTEIRDTLTFSLLAISNLRSAPRERPREIAEGLKGGADVADYVAGEIIERVCDYTEALEKQGMTGRDRFGDFEPPPPEEE